MYPVYTPFVVIAALYFALYYEDPPAIFRHKSGSWSKVFRALNIQFNIKKKINLFTFLLPVGIIVDVVGLYASSLFTFLALEFIGSIGVLSFIVARVPIPYKRMALSLPYPRMGRAQFQGPEKGDIKSSVAMGEKMTVDPSTFKMFYVSNRNAHFFSLPEPKLESKSATPLTDTLAMFLEQSKPQFAWVQFTYERANIHQLLEHVKFGLLNHQQKGAWQPETLVKKVNQALAKELFAVSVRGILVGANPLNINFSTSDEIDSLAIFESRNPNLFYSIVQRKMPKLKVPNYFGSRHETAFFLTADLSKVITPPSVASSAPAGLETIAVGEGEAGDFFEASPVPSIEQPFHFPSNGVIELVYDSAGLHVLFGGEYGNAIRTIGVSTLKYEPLVPLIEAFKGNRNTLP